MSHPEIAQLLFTVILEEPRLKLVEKKSAARAKLVF